MLQIWPGPNSRNFRLPVGQGMTADGLHLRIAMPAVLDEDVAFSVEGNSLLLFGQRKEPEDFGEKLTRRLVLAYGHFHQRVQLPDGLDPARLEATFHHGVLDLYIPPARVSAAVSILLPRKRRAAAVA